MRRRTGMFGTMRKMFVFAAAMFFTMPFSGFALDFFTGLAELSVKFRVPRNSIDDEVNPVLDGFLSFDGQVNVGDLIYARVAMHITTEEDPNDKLAQPDVADQGFFPNAVTGKKFSYAKFVLDEVSVTLKQRLAPFIQYFSVYAGNFEAPGTTTYVSRYLGVAPFSSQLMQTYFGDIGTSFYDRGGMGFSYTMRYRKVPLAFSVYANSERRLLWARDYGIDDRNIPVDDYLVDIPTPVTHVSPGIRLAGAFQMIVFDFALNAVIPFETLTENEVPSEADYVLRTGVGLQGGLTLFVGNRFSQSLLFQAGLAEFFTTEAFKLDNLFLLLEGRLVDVAPVQFHLSVFALPTAKASEMFFVREPFGVNLAVVYKDFYSRTSRRNNTIGLNVTFSARNIGRVDEAETAPEYQALKLDSFGTVPFNLQTMSLYIAPYFSASLFSGRLSFAVHLDMLHLAESWRETFAARLSYRAAF